MHPRATRRRLHTPDIEFVWLSIHDKIIKQSLNLCTLPFVYILLIFFIKASISKEESFAFMFTCGLSLALIFVSMLFLSFLFSYMIFVGSKYLQFNKNRRIPYCPHRSEWHESSFSDGFLLHARNYNRSPSLQGRRIFNGERT